MAASLGKRPCWELLFHDRAFERSRRDDENEMLKVV